MTHMEVRQRRAVEIGVSTNPAVSSAAETSWRWSPVLCAGALIG
jgi:hypothetical protein